MNDVLSIVMQASMPPWCTACPLGAYSGDIMQMKDFLTELPCASR